MSVLRLFRKPAPIEDAQKEARVVADRLFTGLNPKKIFLFGSAVEGPFTTQSDLDFLAIFNSNEEVKEAYKKVGSLYPLSKFFLDLVFLSEEEFEAKKDLGGLPYIVARKGLLLKEKV